MKATELRIGNIVNQGSEGISEVSGYQIHNLSSLNNGGSVADYYKEWEPIPLTEDGLLRLGFKQEDPPFSGIFGLDNIFIAHTYAKHCLEFGEFTFSCNTGFLGTKNIQVKFQYVHQLQNFYFALTGEELTISE